MATRAASGKALNAAAALFPSLIGGSADLAPSNKTFIDGSPEFQKKDYAVAISVSAYANSPWAPSCQACSCMAVSGPMAAPSWFLPIMSGPAIRVAALMKLPVIYVFTHDSVAVGEDGPTHQPVEHLASCGPFPI